ncbi:hypothetical protein D6825_02475 [Candidatus Woesearchaeota archaeon]|nr:MAG: hypothetical protein D6825_02475 [Candidatus Woesearchaeota archaeon]
MADELFFVGIRNSVDVRRELLTSSKDILDILKNYEKYKLMRNEKVLLFSDLKRVFDELLVLNKKLRSKLPKVPIKTPQLKAPKRQVSPARRPARPRVKSKLEKLEEELDRVERRLSSLQ